ncbi:nuclear transport factor 2 family protein [Embleya sp. NPDC056575]|uniref:nuclear transport factor 2 family protein n=1 Tax=unclassified Embleya TaxID=2699296 RepID=UPI00369F4C7E
MITCAHCGAALSAAALRFCTVCGGEVGPRNTETTTLANTPADAGNRRVLLAVLTVLGVATIAVTILLLRESGSGSDTTTAATTTTEAAITPATRTPLPPTPAFVPRTAAASISTGPSPSASFPPTRPPTGTTALATTNTPPSDPATVVARYYDAINRGDYATAWTLGGSNLGSTYTTFVAGFSDTVSDRLTIGSVSGDTVQVRVAAQRTDGSVRLYAGSYTIRNGTITKGTLRATGTTPP